LIFLLGAGASVDAGIPTVAGLTGQLKQRLPHLRDVNGKRRAGFSKLFSIIERVDSAVGFNYERVWFEELIGPDEVAFDAGVFLPRKDSAKALKIGAPPEPVLWPSPQPGPGPITAPEPGPARGPEPVPGATTKTLRLVGTVPPEVWNRLGTKILPKLRAGSDLRIGMEFTVTVKADTAGSLAAELQQILQELGLGEAVRVEEGSPIGSS